jgi:hypothetical protein
MGVDMKTNFPFFLTYRYISYLFVEELPNYTPVVMWAPPRLFLKKMGGGEEATAYNTS